MYSLGVISDPFSKVSNLRNFHNIKSLGNSDLYPNQRGIFKSNFTYS